MKGVPSRLRGPGPQAGGRRVRDLVAEIEAAGGPWPHGSDDGELATDQASDGPGPEAGPDAPSSAERAIAPRPEVRDLRHLAPRPAARPRIVDEPGILGLSRVSRGRVGSRLFTWFFVLVFVLIAVQMVVALLTY